MYATMAAHAALLMLLVEGKENTALHNTCIYTWTDVDVRAAAGGLVGSTKEQAAHRLAGLWKSVCLCVYVCMYEHTYVRVCKCMCVYHCIVSVVIKGCWSLRVRARM